LTVNYFLDNPYIQDEYVEMIEIVDPDKLDMSQRRKFRIEKEHSLFSKERCVNIKQTITAFNLFCGKKSCNNHQARDFCALLIVAEIL
jgi:hypothetical protein